MNSQASRSGKIQTMFDRLAPRYDFMNRVMTFGQDQRWRRYVLERSALPPEGDLLDLAAGTGDIAFLAKRKFPKCRVVAGDFSLGMLAQGKARPGGEAIHWIACDALKLPFADQSFDAVTFGYLLRNVTDIDQALREIYRVLRPGGTAVCLDTTPPPPGLMAPFINFYLKHGLPLLGRVLAGNAASYAYLSNSTLGFQTPERLAEIFAQNGFHNTEFRRFMLKTIAVHWASKPD